MLLVRNYKEKRKRTNYSQFIHLSENMVFYKIGLLKSISSVEPLVPKLLLYRNNSGYRINSIKSISSKCQLIFKVNLLFVNMIVAADSTNVSSVGGDGDYLGGLAGGGSKMFVGGLSWCTTRHSLAAYFGLFGDIEDCTVVTNEQVKYERL